MSNIYGALSTDERVIERADRHMYYWNRFERGLVAEDRFEWNQVAENRFEWGKAGCFRDHLTTRYQAGRPVIQSERVLAVIDAVLYNREELMKELGIGPESIMSDEDLLLQFIVECGCKSLARVNGDFAGAVYHKQDRKWTLFRDHMGVRPLFYYIDNNTMLFSSDVRGIASVSDIDTGITESLIYKYGMGYTYLTQRETAFEHVYCVPPASYMEICLNCESPDEMAETPLIKSVRTESYWELGSTSIRLPSEEAYQKRLFELVEDSVRRRVQAVDGLIGCELSGGLDSGVVVAMLARTGRDIQCYSWSWSPEVLPYLEGTDERKVIEEFCAYVGLNCQFRTRETEQAWREASNEIDSRWPPDINTSHIMEGSLFMNKRGAKVMFTGHGGDEGISHRANAYELFYHGEYLPFFKYFWNENKGRKLRLLRAIKGALVRCLKRGPEYKRPSRSGANAGDYLTDAFRRKMEGKAKLIPYYFLYDVKAYIMNGGSRSRLANTAYQGCAAGMRYMVPFLDYRVIDFAVSIPRYLYVDGVIDRKLYRETFGFLLSPSLRKVCYKQTPSHDAYEPTVEELFEIKEMHRRRILELVQKLDREMWAPYLELDALEQIDFKPDFDNHEFGKASQVYALLVYCLLTQDILKCELD